MGKSTMKGYFLDTPKFTAAYTSQSTFSHRRGGALQPSPITVELLAVDSI